MLTKQNKSDILALFYRTELRKGEKFIDNRDRIIAEELGLKTPNVSKFLCYHSIKKMDEFKLRYSYK